MNKNTAIILAAGKSSRMGGCNQKSFYEIGGEKLIIHLLNSISECNFSNIFIVINKDYEGWQIDYIKNFLLKKNKTCFFIYQNEQKGTGHAVLECINSKEYLEINHENVLIFYADTPLISIESIKNLEKKINDDECGIICGFDFKEDNQYGRIILNNKNQIERIVEYKDYKNDDEIQQISLCNSGIIAIKDNILKTFLGLIDNKNEASEYYLFDIMNFFNKNQKFSFFQIDKDEAIGINTFEELNKAEQIYQNRCRIFWIKNFVQFQNLNSVFFGFDVKIGKFVKIGSNVEIKNNTEIEGDVEIQSNNVIGPKVKIDKGTKIKSFSYIENSTIGQNCEIGPFASITSQNIIGDENIIGNFVEIKRSEIKHKNKIKHLAYCGNLNLGSNNNIGAGSITCNYDGKNKNLTKISDNNFIGANTSLVAPIKIGNKNIIAAGSVITKSIDDDNLVIERGEQKNIKRKKLI
jgi:bifunctional UDP-N-acetylglucosamine pyrophosphorylase/glucosamine-1-phosphate N-acetyltransferase